MSRGRPRRGPEGSTGSTARIVLMIVGPFVGIIFGGCAGFVVQYVLWQSGDEMSDAFALGMICGGGVMGAALGFLGGWGLGSLFTPRPPATDVPNPWGEDEEEEDEDDRPRRRDARRPRRVRREEED